MLTLSIISRIILQDEIIWILEKDSSIDEIIVVGNGNIKEFVEKLSKASIPHKILPLEKISTHVKIENKSNKYIVLIYLMKLGLHKSPQELKNKVYKP